MARGWESKAVEAQVEEARTRRAQEEAAPQLTPAERDRSARLVALKLSRARTLEQLERATNRAHREMLKRTLLALEKELNELE